jgi:myo-inositol-1(or 4)-monophosphatase
VSGGAGERTWYIDPLDGTTNFVHEHPFFAVSIGLGDGAGLRVGVVHAPYLDQLFAAVRGGGARFERPRHDLVRDLPRRGPVRLDDALLATGFPYQRDSTVDRNVEYVRRFLRAGCHGVRRAGSAAIDLAHTAAGVLDGFWELKLRPWDVAAGTLIARETGCAVSDLAGVAADLQWEEILAAPPDLHRAMRAILAAAPPDGRRRDAARDGGEA